LIVAEKNVTKNILDGRKDRGKTVYPPPPPGSGAIIIDVHLLWKPTLYIIIPYIFVLLYKSNKTIQMFFGKYTDEGDNLVENPKIYNVEGDNRLLFGLQTLTTGSVLKILFFFSVQFHISILYTSYYFAVFCKTKHLRVISV
jgi:hypothetical protein